NLRDKQSILNLFSEYIEKNKKNDIADKQKIIKRIDGIINDIVYDKDNICKKIKLCELKFDNIMIYGKNNFINFDNLKKVVGLSGENNIGKSAIIDILLFSVFGECSRGSKVDLVHIGEKK